MKIAVLIKNGVQNQIRPSVMWRRFFCALHRFELDSSIQLQWSTLILISVPLAFQFRPIANTWTSQERTCHLQTPTFLALTISRNAGHVAPYRTNTIVGLSITTRSRKNASFLQTIAPPYRMDCIATGTLSSVNVEAAIRVQWDLRASRVS